MPKAKKEAKKKGLTHEILFVIGILLFIVLLWILLNFGR